MDKTVPVYHLCNPFKVENGLLKLENTESQQEIYDNYLSLEDELSKQIYVDTINWKLCGNMFPLQKYDTGEEIYTFFDKELIKVDINTVYIDIGAYTGDSIESFLIFSGGIFKKIIGVEADTVHYNALNDFIKYSRIKNIDAYNVALWDKEEERIFYTMSSYGRNYDSSNLFQNVESIADNKTRQQILGHDVAYEKKIHVKTLDNILKEEKPTIIKINALAADYNILIGGRKVIEKYKPALIFEYGCKKADIFHMIKMIKKIRSDYKFYMRRKDVFGDIKTILYCI